MENTKNAISSLATDAGEYIETNLHLLKLKAVDKSSKAVSSLFSVVVVFFVFFLVFIFLTIGLALLIGEITGKIYYGFFVIGGFYLLLGLLLVTFRKKWLKEPVDSLMIKELLN